MVRIGIRMFAAVFLLITAGIILFLAAVWINSPGTPRPFLDAKGNVLSESISEKIFVDINGVRQGMFIKSKNKNNPVLLYLHGGMPDYFLTEKFPTGLDEHFTVIWWEQRGSGISYSSDIPRESLTLEQLVADVITMSEYVRDRFAKEKIYLMGHSGGTFIGIHAAAQAPELYYAYIGVAQMSYQLESEKLAYDFILQRFKESGDKSMVQKLEAAPVTITEGTPSDYLSIRDIAMHKLGIGTMHSMHSLLTGILLPSLFFPEYTITEKKNLWMGKTNAGVSVVWDRMMKIDLRQQVTELKIPAYFFHGTYDYTCNVQLAESYFKILHTPVKGFYRFTRSAHSPMFEEPERMNEIILNDVLTGGNRNADLQY